MLYLKIKINLDSFLKTKKKSLPVSSGKVQPEGHAINPEGAIMSIKYHKTSIITNDLYLAAYLLSEGCELSHLERNARRRVSFVFSGDRVKELRDNYQSGIVRLNIRSYRDNLKTVRRKMDAEHRSVSCPKSNLTMAISPAH
jgi:hypothetical protein